MDRTQNRLHRARKYLETFEESWRADHEAAMDCRDFEEGLAEAVKVFGLVDALIRVRREAVFRGLEETNAELDQAEKKLFQDWMAMTEESLTQLAEFETTFGAAEGADAFRACRERAKAFLANWAPAVPSTAMGSRSVDLSEEDADDIHALLNSPPGATGRPKLEPRSVPRGDETVLR
jgi:hypothetical protein